MTKQKLRVISSFTYKGKDGKAKQDKWVSIGPGEECPSLDENERERLIMMGVICEVDMYGENVISKKLMKMNEEEIERLFAEKGPGRMLDIISSTYFEKETLAKMLVYAEKMRMPPMIAKAIEAKM
jgi:hypothetical protein